MRGPPRGLPANSRGLTRSLDVAGADLQRSHPVSPGLTEELHVVPRRRRASTGSGDGGVSPALPPISAVTGFLPPGSPFLVGSHRPGDVHRPAAGVAPGPLNIIFTAGGRRSPQEPGTPPRTGRESPRRSLSRSGAQRFRTGFTCRPPGGAVVQVLTTGQPRPHQTGAAPRLPSAPGLKSEVLMTQVFDDTYAITPACSRRRFRCGCACATTSTRSMMFDKGPR